MRGIIFREKTISEIIGNEDVYYFQNHAAGVTLKGGLSKLLHTYEVRN